MKKKLFLVGIFIGLAVSLGLHLVQGQNWNHHGRFGGGFFFPPFGAGAGRTHVGIFPIHRSGHSGSFFFGNFRGGSWNHRLGSFGEAPYWAPYGNLFRERNQLQYSSARFIEKWADREPEKIASESRIEQSLILAPGMSEEEVVKILGTPLQRRRLEGREVWKYSSYSLWFESGVLTEIQ